MKRILILALLFVPTMSFAAPSVRMLGNKAPTNLSGQPATNVKVTPTKSTSNSNETALSRVGTLRTNPKTGASVTGAITSSGSRFPVITPAQSYNSVGTPSASTGTNVIISGVDEKAIQDAVETAKEEIIREVNNNYYTKETVYTTTEFKEATDDPRLDAIRLVNPATAENRRGQVLPDDYVYIWIEKEQ